VLRILEVDRVLRHAYLSRHVFHPPSRVCFSASVIYASVRLLFEMLLSRFL